ncbi:MAG: hypothetical protein AB1798_12840 [Spirochaetota bacterium]
MGSSQVFNTDSQVTLSERLGMLRMRIGFGRNNYRVKPGLYALGSPGVAGHEVKRRTGFKVIYGPVRATDIKRFLENGMEADEEMRTVRFDLRDRAALIWVDVVSVLKILVPVVGALFVLSVLTKGRVSFAEPTLALAALFTGGIIMVPLLLPWLPGKAFAVKGTAAGLLCAAGFAAILRPEPLAAVGWGVLITTVTSYIGMNFTGASTYTSLSGVVKEMKIALPLQLAALAAGIICLAAAQFV